MSNNSSHGGGVWEEEEEPSGRSVTLPRGSSLTPWERVKALNWVVREFLKTGLGL